MKKIAALLGVLATTVALADTQIVNGIEWTYVIEGGEASVGGGMDSSPAVSTSTRGAISIPSTLGGCPVTGIGYYAFGWCSELTSISIPNGVTTIDEGAFSGCSGLTAISIPAGVTSIRANVFSECSGLVSVTIPAGITSIGDSAFSFCSGLASITIPAGVTSIGGRAFANCSRLKSVYFDGAPPTAYDSSFLWCPEGASGFYRKQYASAWAAVIEEDGTWHGLRMGSGAWIPEIERYHPSDGWIEIKWAHPDASSIPGLTYSVYRGTKDEISEAVCIKSGLTEKSYADFDFYSAEPLTRCLYYWIVAVPPAGTTIDENLLRAPLESDPLETRRRFALVAGTGPEEAFSHDADCFATALSSRGGFTVLKRSTLDGVRGALSDIVSQTSPGDFFLFVFSGEQNETTGGLRLDGGIYSPNQLKADLNAFPDAGVARAGIIHISGKMGTRPTHWFSPDVDDTAWIVSVGEDVAAVSETGWDGQNRSFFANAFVSAGWQSGYAGTAGKPVSLLDLGAFSKRMQTDILGGWQNVDLSVDELDVLKHFLLPRLTAKPASATPEAPESVSASQGTDSSAVLVSWQQPTGTSIEGAIVKRRIGSGPKWEVLSPLVRDTSYSDTTADSSGTRHKYEVCLWNWNGLGPYDDTLAEGWKQKTSNIQIQPVETNILAVAIYEEFEHPFFVDDGEPPFVFAVQGPGWPEGVTISNAVVETNGVKVPCGLLCGSATELGSFTNAITVTDASSATATLPTPFVLTVTNIPPVILTEALPEAESSVPYSVQLEARGGVEPYSWSLSISGEAPTWMEIDETGLITASPDEQTPGSQSVEVEVSITDATGETTVKTFSLSIFVNPFTYRISGGSAIITGYKTTPTGALAIPATCGGYPVTEIDYDAFSGCSELTSVTIPVGVMCIDGRAFLDCSGLTSVTIPDGVTSIGYSAFSGCSGLTSITIPASVTSIADEVFYYCSGLTSITIPDSVTSIGRYAFGGCSGLTSIRIPARVTSIEDSAFSGCSSLMSITIPDSITIIEDLMFQGCSSLTSVTIPDSVTSIGSQAFQGCSGLESITIPDRVTSIGYSAFSGCSGLMSISIPDSVTSIGPYAFQQCSSLTSISIPDSVTSIGAQAFRQCSRLASITIPDSVTSIADEVFYYCSGLTSITIPDGLTNIGAEAFSCCSSLTSITIPNSVTNIGNYAFGWCYGLTSIAIPVSVANIGRGAFSSCRTLTALYVPSSFTSSDAQRWSVPNGCTITFYDAPAIATEALPSGEFGTVYSATLAAVGGVGDFTWTAAESPDWLSLSQNGVLSGTPPRAGTWEVSFVATDSIGNLARKILELDVAGPLVIVTEALPGGQEQESYEAALSAAGGSGNYTWSAAGLPAGLSVSASGTISGTPTESGTFAVVATVTDSLGASATATFSLVVDEPPPSLAIVTDATLPDASLLLSYTATLVATGGVTPYSWSVPGAEVPTISDSSAFAATGTAQGWQADDGCWTLSLPFSFPYFGNVYGSVKVNSNGTLSFGEDDFSRYSYDEDAFLETPTIAVLWTDLRTDGSGRDVFVSSDASSMTVRWKAEYYNGGVVNASATLHSDGRIVLAYGSGNEDGGFVGFSAGDGTTFFEVAEPDAGWGGAPDVSFSAADAGSFPPGLSLSEGGILSGTPTAVGAYSFRVSVSSADGQIASKTFSLLVAAAPLSIVTDATLPVALTDAYYWQPVAATGGVEPYTWEIVDEDDWPEWLDRDYIDYWDDWGYSSPHLSGWPDEDDIGTYTFALRVTDAEGASVERTFTLEVQENPNPPPVLDSFTGPLRIQPGETGLFSVEAHDPKGDDLSYQWRWCSTDDWDYQDAGTGTTFGFSPGTEGEYYVCVVVSDGVNEREWGRHVTVSIPRTIYVDQTSTADDPDGTSWETAYPTLSEAANEASEGDTVLVAPGVYAEDAWFQPGAVLRSRDGAATTVLDGENVRQCVQYYNGNSDAGFAIAGFTLRNGSNGGNGRPALVYGGTSLSNCVIENCVGTKIPGVVEECELVNCTIRNCRTEDQAWMGLVVECDLVNCVLSGNRCEDAWNEAAIVADSRLWNCTVAGNVCGLWGAADADCVLWNCILWDNPDENGTENSFQSSTSGWDDETQTYTTVLMPAVTNCCLAGMEEELEWLADMGFVIDLSAQGCSEVNPRFVDLANGDFRLRAGSPCVDAGANEWVRGATDIAGNARVQGAEVDLGAYEGAVDGFVLSVRVVGAGTVSPMSALVQAGGSATFAATESAGRPFRGWTVGGADVGAAATYTWSDVQSDGELVATFGAFAFCVDAATGDDANDGLSWAAPKATIQAAVDAAADDECVSVKPGVYGPINAAGTTLRIESTDGRTVTIIDGGGTNRCAYLGTGAGRGATMSGFTLRNGNASWNASPKAGIGGGAYGGTLLDCDITGCEAYEQGGGLAYSEAHRCAIVRNGIFDGDGYAYGGGAADGTLYSCLVASNAVSLVLGTQDSSATALGGGAAWCSLYQCTVADNIVEIVGDTTGVDITVGAGGTLYGSNAGNIVYGNMANGEPSNVENWDGPLDAAGSLVGVDPLFVDRANGDYRLRANSPAVDVGATDVETWRDPATTDTDLDGNSRVRGKCIDLGCYESAWTMDRTETVTTPDPVPYSWLDDYRLAGGEGYELAAAAMASNNMNKVWQCYVTGLVPTNETARFEARIEFDTDGNPVVKWTPDLNEGGTKHERVYTVEGKTNLTDKAWGPANEATRFFRVKVSMPE